MKVGKPLILILVLLVAGATLGGVYLMNRSQTESSQPEAEMPGQQEAVSPRNGSGTEEENLDFSGTVLAGTNSKLYDFNKADLDKAKETDLLIVLYFYANWCPICRDELPHLYGAFNELSTDAVIGFRVSYNDSDTDSFERDLAREYGVTYQHTKVFVKNGQRVLKSPESWKKPRYLSEINNHVN